MNPADLKLDAVNWEHGMLLTPEHFLRQERYFDACLLWSLRYSSHEFGLVGGGPRLPEAERGAVRHDPVLAIDQNEEQLSISVSQCRAITPAGCIVDVDPEHAIERRFAKSDLDGVPEPRIYIVFDPSTKQVIDGPVDEFNPQMRTERRPSYSLALSVSAHNAPYAVSIARLRRQRHSAAYERDPAYIPPCTTLASYSELAAACRKIVDSITFLTERYTELHRAMREFQILFTERGIETELDAETLGFVDRMVVALQNCIYELLDPVQVPQRFFAKLRQLFHTAAVYLDLAPSVQQYFETLKQTGETEFIALVDQQKKILKTTRSQTLHDDLGMDVREVGSSVAALQRLERALEGKYLDFHVSPSLEAMNFVFDRGGRVLYKLAARDSRVQGVGDEIVLHFAQLRLEGREKYRLILVGEPDAVFEPGTAIIAEIRLNEGSGFQRAPIRLSSESKTPDQRNFEYDFDAPDVPVITDIRVNVQAHYPIRSGLLFARHRFYAAQSQENARRLEPLQPGAREAPQRPTTPAPWELPEAREPQRPAARPPRIQDPGGAARESSPNPPPRPARLSDRAPGAESQTPPRRRRLEDA